MKSMAGTYYWWSCEERFDRVTPPMTSHFPLKSGVLDILAMSHMTKASSRQKAREETRLQRFVGWFYHRIVMVTLTLPLPVEVSRSSHLIYTRGFQDRAPRCGFIGVGSNHMQKHVDQ